MNKILLQMKKFLMALLLPLMMVVAIEKEAKGQTTVVKIGDDQTTYSSSRLPFCNYFTYGYGQMVYRQEEVGLAGSVGAITFQNASTSSTVLREVTIWMGHSTTSIFNDDSWVAEDSLTQVFHATNFTIPAGTGDFTVVLDTPFQYDGTRDLAICVSQKSVRFETGVKFKFTQTDLSTCIYRGNDNDQDYSNHPGTTYGIMTAERPNIAIVKSFDDGFCWPVNNFEVTNVTDNKVEISWEPMQAGNNTYEVAILDTILEGSNLNLATSQTTSATNHTFQNLQPNTIYKIGVRNACGNGLYSDWCTALVHTTMVPEEVPYVCDFDLEEVRGKWFLDNGQMTNHWAMNVYANDNYSLYITNGTEIPLNEYTTADARGNVFATCLVHFPDSGDYDISYDWRCKGEDRQDYMRVMLVPIMESEVIASGSSIHSDFTSTTLPEGLIALDGGAQLNGSSRWRDFRDIVTVPHEGNYYLTVLWVNNYRNGENPPAAIDNISITPTVCFGLDSVVVNQITATSATLNAYGRSQANYKLYYRLTTDDDYDTLEVTSPYTLTDLYAGSAYEGYMRPICGEEECFEATPFSFRTACTTIEMPWLVDAEAEFDKHRTGSERFPYCWECVNGDNSSYYWKDVTERAKVHSGERAIRFYGSSYGDSYDEWLISPMIHFEGGAEMTMWVKSEGAMFGGMGAGRFAIYASTEGLTSATDTAHFEPLTITGVNMATNSNIINSNHVRIQNTQYEQIKVSLPTTLVGDHRLAFVVKGVQSCSFDIDDIYIFKPTSCATPSHIRLTEVESTTATLSWESEASSFTVYYGEAGFRMSEALSVSTTDTVVALTGLTPHTEYEYILVATCNDGETSTPTPAVAFHTSCSPILNSELPFVEDFSDNELGTGASLDYCWNKGTNDTWNYPYVINGRDSRTPNALLMHSDVLKYCYVALPAFEESVNNLVLSCSVRHQSDEGLFSSNVVVGLMSNPQDYATFTPFDTLCPTARGEWNDFQLPLLHFNANAGSYIAFAMPKGEENEALLDNIKVEEAGDCVAPSNIAVPYVSYDEAQVSWSAEGASSWTVYYGAPGFDIETVMDAEAVQGSTSTYITGLLPQTEYEVCVVSNCDNGGYSIESLRQRFTTECAPISDLPYLETFEAYGSGSNAEIDACWVKNSIGPSGKNYPFPADMAKIHGHRGLVFKAAENRNASYKSYVALPAFDEEVINLKVRFDMKSSVNPTETTMEYTKLAVGVMSDPADIATFDTVAIFDMSNELSGTVHTNEVLFDHYQGAGRYIAMMAMDVARGTYDFANNNIYVDDIEVNLIPACARPSQLTAVMDKSTADLSWVGNSSEYEVKYSQHQDLSDSTVVTAQGNSILLNRLTPNTEYYVNVRGICDDGSYSEWMFRPVKMRTLMDCGDGYQHLFDTLGNGSNDSYYYSLNGSHIDPDTRTWNIYTHEELTAMGLMSNNNLIHSLSLHASDVGDALYFRIYMAEDSIAEFSRDLSDTIPLSDMTLVYDGMMQFEADSWNEIVFDTPFRYRDSANLVVAFERNIPLSEATRFYYTQYSQYRTAYVYGSNYGYNPTRKTSMARGNVIFNICAEVPSCIRPMEVAASQITSSNAVISWEGSSDQYQVVYTSSTTYPDELTLNASNSVMENANQVTLQGLTPNTTYNIYVRGFCGLDTSLWSNPISFTTPCGVFALPFSENFDRYIASSDEYTMSPCWVLANNGTSTLGVYPNISDIYASSGANSLKFYATPDAYSYAAMPQFNTAISNISISFKLHKMQPEYGTLQIGVMTDPHNVNTFELVTTVKPQQVGRWEEFEVSMADYAGNGQYITFMAPDSIFSFVSMDDLELFENPTCQAPIEVTVAEESITSNSAVVSWSDRSTPSAGYMLQYGPEGFILGTGDSITSTTNPTTLTGLQPATRYEVYVKALCSASSASRWSIVAPFVTSCVPIALPATYNFDAEEAGDEVPLPLCFSRFNDAQLPDEMNYPYIGQTAIFSHSENNYIYFAMGSSEGQADREAIIFPEIDIVNYPINNSQVSLWGRCRDSVSLVAVGVISDPDNIATFVPIDTLPLTDTYNEYIVNLSQYTGLGARIAIMAHSTTAPYTAYIDDVAIESIPTCPRVFDLHTVSVSGTSATVDWTDSGNPSQWVVDYHEANATTVQHFVTNHKPCTLTGLAEMTNYVFNVRPICGVGDTGNAAVSEGSFATLLSPASIPYAYDFESASESGKWRIANADPTVNWYRGANVPQCQGTYSMYVSADQGASCSTDWWDVYNTAVYRDIDFGSDTSSFTLTFKAKVGGTSDYEEIMDDDICEGLYVMLVDPLQEVSPSNDIRISPWGDPDTMGTAVLTHLRNNVPWRTYSITIDNVAGTQRLAFYWCNTWSGMMGGMVTEISCAIDSLVISEQSCPRPQALQLTDASSSSATIAWQGHASQYQVTYRPTRGVSSATYQLAQGNSTTINSLRANTEYQCQVRAICSAGDTSAWSEVMNFTTNCQLYTAADTIREDFSSVEGVRYNEAGLVPNCWQAYPETHDGYQPHVVGQGSYWYSLEGNSLTMTAGQFSGHTASVVRLPYTLEPVNSLTLSYWMCTESNSKGQLQVGYLTGVNYETDFVAVDSIKASSATVHRTSSGAQGDSVGYFDTITFNNIPDEAQAVAFRWINDSRAAYAVCIDDVVLLSSYNCDAPTIDTIVKGLDSIALSWQGSASNYQLLIKETTALEWGDTIHTTDTHYTFHQLLPATEYDVALRAQCDENNYSAWVENLIVTNELQCEVPTNLSVEADYDQALLAWQCEGDASQWVIRLTDIYVTRMDTVTSNPFTLTDLHSATEYSVAVKSLCSESVSSDWSEAITFTTKSCPEVTHVKASDITAHSAIISWQCPEGLQWELMYGVDIDLSTGIAEFSDEPHYTLTNLDADTRYDVYVRSVCSETTFGQWSSRYRFTTEADNPEAIDGVEGNYQFTIYPNPAHGATTITLQGVEGKVQVSVVDMNGRTIVSESIECGAECEKRIDVAHLAQGTYFVRVLGNGVNSVRKLIVR